MKPSVSIVTPWHNQPQFIETYEQAVCGADEVILIDNASDERTVNALFGLRNRLSAGLITNSTNKSYGEACNQGIAEASGDIIVCLNNDVRAKYDWLKEVREDVRPGAFYGPTIKGHRFFNIDLFYVEGWCLAATRETWAKVGAFDTDYYHGNYWEDVDLCVRAVLEHNMKLLPTTWPIEHLNDGNNTSNLYPEKRLQDAAANRTRFLDRFRGYLEDAK